MAPRGATSTDAGVTNAAISYTTPDFKRMLTSVPTQADRRAAARRAAPGRR